jgi:hypothetical protein
MYYRKGFEEYVREEPAQLETLKYKKGYKLIAFLKTLQRLKHEWQKSPALEQTDGENMVWFGKIERQLAKLSMPTFTYHSSS